MTLTLSAFAKAEKNKVVQGTAWLTFLEIAFPNEVQPYRIVNNTENLTWAGQTWEAVPFIVGEIPENLNELPQTTIEISNVTQVIESFCLRHAYFTKTDGIQPVTIKIMVCNSGNLANATPETLHEFEITQVASGVEWATITAGIPNLFRRLVTTSRAMKNQCQYPFFAGTECGYAGATTTCDRTLATCRTLGNSARFGGFPGVNDTVFRGA